MSAVTIKNFRLPLTFAKDALAERVVLFHGGDQNQSLIFSFSFHNEKIVIFAAVKQSVWQQRRNLPPQRRLLCR